MPFSRCFERTEADEREEGRGERVADGEDIMSVTDSDGPGARGKVDVVEVKGRMGETETSGKGTAEEEAASSKCMKVWEMVR